MDQGLRTHGLRLGVAIVGPSVRQETAWPGVRLSYSWLLMQPHYGSCGPAGTNSKAPKVRQLTRAPQLTHKAQGPFNTLPAHSIATTKWPRLECHIQWLYLAAKGCKTNLSYPNHATQSCVSALTKSGCGCLRPVPPHLSGYCTVQQPIWPIRVTIPSSSLWSHSKHM